MVGCVGGPKTTSRGGGAGDRLCGRRFRWRLDYWRTTSIDQEHLVTALAAIAVFLAGETARATGQPLEQVLKMLVRTWRLVAPWNSAAHFSVQRKPMSSRGAGRKIVGEG